MGELYVDTDDFNKTGCLITAYGSEVVKIRLEDHVVPPPLPVDVSLEIEPDIPAPAEEAQEVDTSDDMGQFINLNRICRKSLFCVRGHKFEPNLSEELILCGDTNDDIDQFN